MNHPGNLHVLSLLYKCFPIQLILRLEVHDESRRFRFVEGKKKKDLLSSSDE